LYIKNQFIRVFCVIGLAIGFVTVGAVYAAPGPIAGQAASQAQTRPPDPAAVRAPVPAAAFKAPDDVDFRSVNIMSEGVRLHGEVFSLKSLAGKRLPTIVMAHGWGGTAANFRTDAIDFARAGYLVITFDYRGWGESDSRVILTGPSPISPKSGQDQKFTAEVTEIREVVDPEEQGRDWLNVIDWAWGEPIVDTDRIGVRGSSFSGGHVIWVAARDPRIKAAVSQVGSMDGRWVIADKQQTELTYEEATKRAHGELGYPAPRARVIGNLIGAPIRSKFEDFVPAEDAPRIKDCAVLFIVAEKEELFDNSVNAKLAYERLPGTKKKYVVVPGITHYGVYLAERQNVVKMAIEWFDQYLKK
jgi:dienelactone hydrolase